MTASTNQSEFEILTCAIQNATRKVANDLFSVGEHFYYFTLATTEEGFAPVVSAWSREALERVAATFDDPEQARQDIKWSYADSPYFDFGEAYFSPVKNILAGRGEIDSFNETEWNRELAFRLDAMEEALRRLDSGGVFGVGISREAIVIAAEIMPPVPSNTDRVKRLNPSVALTEWLAEAAE